MMYGGTHAAALAGAAVPGWVAAKCGALAPYVTFAAHDDIGRYWANVPGYARREYQESECFSNSRTGTRWAANAAGVYVSAPSGQTLVIPDGTGAPLLQSITNKCTNFSANPPALVTPTTATAFTAAVTNMTATAAGAGTSLFGVIDDTAAITAGGLINATNARVYQADNTNGTGSSPTVSVGGSTGDTNAHVLTVFARGSGTFRFALGATLSSVMTLTAAYQRFTAIITPPDATHGWAIVVPSGSVVDFTLNSLVENSFDIPTLVPVAGASATVGADVRQLIGPAAAAALSAKAAFFKTNAVAGLGSGVASRLLSFGGGGFMVYPSTTLINISTSTNATIGNSGTIAGPVKSAFGFDASGTTELANGGTKVTSATTFSGQSGAVYLGDNGSGIRDLNGFQQEFALSNVKGLFDGIPAP